MKALCDIGLIGLAVMGENLVRNMAGKGIQVAVYNRTASVVEAFVGGVARDLPVRAAASVAELVAMLERPRRVMLMVKAGRPVDDMIAQLLLHLEPGDIVIDGGNSLFHDTRRRHGELKAHGIHYVGMGVSGAFLTGDLFNLYVWFEVMLMASFVLVSLGGEREQLTGGLRYVVLNLVSSAFFLAGAGLLYATVGTLSMADAAVALRALPAQGTTSVVAALFLLAFGIKAAAFPLFFWLPASYHTPPMPVAALFAGLLTKVGVYALVRTGTLVFDRDRAFTDPLLLAVAGLTMVTGVLGAMAQTDVRKVLSFHIVSQIGYMLMGLGLGTRLAIAGTVFYVLHHIVVKANLFLVAGVVRRVGGGFSLDRLGGLLARSPLLAAAFLVPALSLAGLPPLSGFWAKYLLVRAGLEAGHGAIVAVALAVSLLTLFSMTKIWAEAFWKPAPDDAGAPPLSAAERLSLLGPILALGAITVAIGLGAGVLFRFADAAAAQLLDPELYVRAVLGARGGGG